MTECLYYWGQASQDNKISLFIRSNGIDRTLALSKLESVLARALLPYSRTDLGLPLATSIIYRW